MTDEAGVVRRELTVWMEARLLGMSEEVGVAVRAAGREGAGLDETAAARLVARTIVELAHLDDCVAELPTITAATRDLARRHDTDLETAFRVLADASRSANRTLGEIAEQVLAEHPPTIGPGDRRDPGPAGDR